MPVSHRSERATYQRCAGCEKACPGSNRAGAWLGGLSDCSSECQRHCTDCADIIVRAFKAAMNDVLTQAQENKDDALALLTDFIDLPPEAAANMRFEGWDAEIQRDEIDQLNELALDHDYIEYPIDPEGFYFK